ncbi:TPA: hypothetical protein N0F65_012979, partial [Lagenidium giganteum]
RKRSGDGYVRAYILFSSCESIDHLAKCCQKTSLLTALAVFSGLLSTRERRRDTYQGSSASAQRLQFQKHANSGNKHAAWINKKLMADRFREVAQKHGEVKPVRFRHRKNENGNVTRYHT